MDPGDFDKFIKQIRGSTRDQLAKINQPAILTLIMSTLSNDQKVDFMIAKNTAMSGGIHEFVTGFVEQTRGIKNMPEGPGKESAKKGQRLFVERLLTKPDVSEEDKAALRELLTSELQGGRRYRKTRKSKSKNKRRRTVKK